MTNKELRAHLLIEAANTLEEMDESAGRNSMLEKIYKQRSNTKKNEKSSITIQI